MFKKTYEKKSAFSVFRKFVLIFLYNQYQYMGFVYGFMVIHGTY